MRFKELFDKTYQQADDLETRWQLGGAINDYLRRYPNTVSVPLGLPWQLLQSDDVEARVIGLKLVNRCNVPNTQRIDEFIRAIERGDDYESVGGLHELGQFLESCHGRGERISASSAERLRRVLENFNIRSDYEYRGWVEILADLIATVRM